MASSRFYERLHRLPWPQPSHPADSTLCSRRQAPTPTLFVPAALRELAMLLAPAAAAAAMKTIVPGWRPSGRHLVRPADAYGLAAADGRSINAAFDAPSIEAISTTQKLLELVLNETQLASQHPPPHTHNTHTHTHTLTASISFS